MVEVGSVFKTNGLFFIARRKKLLLRLSFFFSYLKFFLGNYGNFEESYKGLLQTHKPPYNFFVFLKKNKKKDI